MYVSANLGGGSLLFPRVGYVFDLDKESLFVNYAYLIFLPLFLLKFYPHNHNPVKYVELEKSVWPEAHPGTFGSDNPNTQMLHCFLL